MSHAHDAPHWADIGESTSAAGVLFLCWVHRWFGRWPFRLCVYPVVLFHWLANRTARQASLEYLRRLQADAGVFDRSRAAEVKLRSSATARKVRIDSSSPIYYCSKCNSIRRIISIQNG